MLRDETVIKWQCCMCKLHVLRCSLLHVVTCTCVYMWCSPPVQTSTTVSVPERTTGASVALSLGRSANPPCVS